jgi:hypothetical protein
MIPRRRVYLLWGVMIAGWLLVYFVAGNVWKQGGWGMLASIWIYLIVMFNVGAWAARRME